MDQYTSAIESRNAVHAGRKSAVDLTGEALLLIESIDSSDYVLNSVLALTSDALDQATANDKSAGKRPLEGLPILIKDNIEAVGLPATAGSLALVGRVVTKDSALVSRLRDAGAVIIGATNLSEWANIRSSNSTSGWSGVGGLTANPWIHSRSAGGSSSGSGAAVAAGLVPLVIGSETDGSIICPASLNGCVGIKPTVGSVPRDGMVPISTSQDSPGPMGRSVGDIALLLEVLMAKTGFVDVTANQDELRIGVVREWLTKHDATNALFEESVRKLANAGINLVEINLPTPKESVSDEEFQVLMYELKTDLGRYLKARPGDGVKSLEDVVKFNLAHADQEMEYFKQEIFDQAVQLGGRSKVYQKIRDRNLAWAQATLTKAFDGVDVLVGATYAPAWVSALGQGDDFSTASSITLAPSIAGTPIGALPMGLVDGLPVGMGVLSRKNDEINLVRAMARIESILGLGILVPTFRK